MSEPDFHFLSHCIADVHASLEDGHLFCLEADYKVFDYFIQFLYLGGPVEVKADKGPQVAGGHIRRYSGYRESSAWPEYRTREGSAICLSRREVGFYRVDLEVMFCEELVCPCMHGQ